MPLAPDRPTTSRGGFFAWTNFDPSKICSGPCYGPRRVPAAPLEVTQVVARVDGLHEVLLGQGALGELERRQRLGAVEDDLRLHDALLHPVVPIGARIQVRPEGVRNDLHVAVGLEAHRHRPQDFLLVERIDVVVDDHHVLDVRLRGQCGEGGLRRLALGALVQRDVAERTATAGPGQVDTPEVGADRVDRPVERAHPRNRAEYRVLRVRVEQVLADRVVAHRYRRDLDVGPRAFHVVVAGPFTEGDFVLTLRGLDVALDHDLRVGRHGHVHGLALDDLEGLAHQRSAQFHFPAGTWHLGHRGQVERGMVPDDDGHRRRLAVLLVIGVDVAAVVGRVHHEPQLPWPLQLKPVHAHVDRAGAAFLHDGDARRDIAAGIVLALMGQRELRQVRVLAGQDHVADGRSGLVDVLHRGWVRFPFAMQPLAFEQVLHAHRDGHPLVRRVQVDQDRKIRAAHVPEQHGRELVGPLQLGQQGGDLVVGVDLPGYLFKVSRALLCDLIKEGPQALRHVIDPFGNPSARGARPAPGNTVRPLLKAGRENYAHSCKSVDVVYHCMPYIRSDLSHHEPAPTLRAQRCRSMSWIRPYGW